MFAHLTKSTQKAVADLRKLRPQALQYANALARMNFEKPFTAFTFSGSFTVNSVKKAVPVKGEWIAVLYMQHKRYGAGSVYAVTLSSDASKFDRPGVRGLYGYKIDYFYTAGDFEESRKANAGKVFVLVQAVEHLNDKPAPGTPDYLTALRNGERFSVAGTKYSRIYVRRIDGRGEQYEADIDRSGWRYGDYGRALSLVPEPIDKSGYCPVPAVEERLRKASALRRERAAAAAAAYDCSEDEKRIEKRIEDTRTALAAYLCDYTGGAGSWDAGSAYRNFVSAVNSFKMHKAEHAAGKYADVQHIKRTLAEIEKTLQEVADFINPPAEQPEEAAATVEQTEERPEIICAEVTEPETTAEPVVAEQSAEQSEEAAAAEIERPETISQENQTQEDETMQPVYTFTADSITVNGKTFAAAYSVTPNGSVFAFVTVEGEAAPVRVKFTPDRPEYQAARDAAEGKAEAHTAEPETATEPPAVSVADAAEPQPTEQPEERPETICAEAAEPEAPAEIVTETAPEAAAEPEEAPAVAEPVNPKARRGEIPEKTFVGDCISGKGWCIVFDKAMQRTRVIIKHPSKAARDAIKAAGFYWSPKAGSWNKKLTHRAHRAAEALAETLAAVC